MPVPAICLLPNVFAHDYSTIASATWQQIHDDGITSLELGATSDPFPQPVIDGLRSHGFSFLGHGSSLWILQQHLPRFLADAQHRGESHLLCYWPWLDAADHITRSQISATAGILSDIGRRCRDAGLTFAFHNHGIEFQVLDGLTICDHLLHETDPQLVSLELDLYHVVQVGYDPLPFLARQRDRIEILHLNAMDGCGDACVVGDGIPDFEKMLQSVPSARWVIEGHGQKDPLRFVRESHRRLKALSRSASPQ